MTGGVARKLLVESEPPSSNDLYSFLDTIPDIKKALQDKAQPEWDSGVTARMNQASYDYIDGLEGILVGLAKFYSAKCFDEQEPHEFFSEIISTRFRWHRMPSSCRRTNQLKSVSTGVCTRRSSRYFRLSVIQAMRRSNR